MTTRYGGWTRQSLLELIERLVELNLVHGSAMLEAIENGGFLGRARVLELAGRPRHGRLTGWIRPMNRVVTTMKTQGRVGWDAIDPLVPMYDEQAVRAAAYGYRMPAPLVDLILRDV